MQNRDSGKREGDQTGLKKWALQFEANTKFSPFNRINQYLSSVIFGREVSELSGFESVILTQDIGKLTQASVTFSSHRIDLRAKTVS